MFLWNRDITFAKIDWGLISILTWYCHTAVLIKTCLSPFSPTNSPALFSPFITVRVVMRVAISLICTLLSSSFLTHLILILCFNKRMNRFYIDWSQFEQLFDILKEVWEIGQWRFAVYLIIKNKVYLSFSRIVDMVNLKYNIRYIDSLRTVCFWPIDI